MVLVKKTYVKRTIGDAPIETQHFLQERKNMKSLYLCSMILFPCMLCAGISPSPSETPAKPTAQQQPVKPTVQKQVNLQVPPKCDVEDTTDVLAIPLDTSECEEEETEESLEKLSAKEQKERALQKKQEKPVSEKK